MKAKPFFTGLYYVAASALLGFLLGGYLGANVFGSKSAMGWDQLADFLGGVMVGVVVALGAAALTVRKLGPRRRMLVGSVFLVACAGLTLLFRLTAQ